jgi:hypothetical protein
MPTHPAFTDKETALETAKSTASITKTVRYVVCYAGRYYVRLQHTPGPLANWFAVVQPDGTIVNGF